MTTYGYLLALTVPDGLPVPEESAVEHALNTHFPAEIVPAATLMGEIDVIDTLEGEVTQNG